MAHKQRGFTLVEIAIVLVIIGLLLGGMLKGQELINSARVRNLADTNSGIQAAYYGFVDRYRKVPGDMSATDATKALGVTVRGGGDGNGKIDAGNYEEASAVWEHLTKSGFLQGSYKGGATDQGSYSESDKAPTNVFSGYMLLSRTRDYQTESAGDPTRSTPDRLGLVLGDNIPVDVARELDVKLDDANPQAGVLRFTTDKTPPSYGVSKASSGMPPNDICLDGGEWAIAKNAQGCNLIYLY